MSDVPTADPPDGSPPTTRRRLLQLLAASTGGVAAGQLIVSQPAFAVASQGSDVCCYRYIATPILTSSIVNRPGNQADNLTFTVSGDGGNCPCGGAETIEYAYFVRVNAGIGTTTWIASNVVTVTSAGPLWPNNGAFLEVGVGIRVTCPGRAGVEAVCCRYASARYTFGQETTSRSLSITGTSIPPGPPSVTLPGCAAGLLRSSSTSSGQLTITPG